MISASEAKKEIEKSYGTLISAAPWTTDALRSALDALGYAEPAKPDKGTGFDWLGNDITVYRCPNCSNAVKPHEDSYCSCCGQCMDWENVPGGRKHIEAVLKQMKKELGE